MSNFIAASMAFCLFGLANSLLGNRPMPSSQSFDQPLVSELEYAFGSGHRYLSDARIEQVAKLMRPTGHSIAKNHYGRLGYSGSRYILHRYFVQRHGWLVSNLDPAGELWEGITPTEILSHGPVFVKKLFEKRLDNEGLHLEEVAALAATFEHLVHIESLERLSQAYAALNLPLDNLISGREAGDVIDAYMLSYMYGTTVQVSNTTVKSILRRATAIPAWRETQGFAREVQKSILLEDGVHSFENISRVVEEVADQYGSFQNLECRELTAELLSIEHQHRSGRVSLASFYGSVSQEKFKEAPAYLRNLGALDESVAGDPVVIIPNYIVSPTNCLASSNYYSVCCIDECEGLMVKLESEIGAPDAPPSQVARIVSRLQHGNHTGNRALEKPLLERLNDIAVHHGGRVPLHGRLFQQWMHHAYPHECQYPHVAGTTQPLRWQEWQTATGLSPSVSDAEREHYTRTNMAPQESWKESEMESSMWTMEEELVVKDNIITTPFLHEQCISFVAFVALAIGWVWAGKHFVETEKKKI